ncbi:zwei Ig domain protein zig-8-like isoform X1 [Aphis craccivora]|uniref:Zwei Ig domain protein zig-8-like isoform X1 n=1 Tax=Aphis craccivora TaxID=307492 RepID=A0A6G0ZQU7_APHCR|nr:zwei Ig domain protein zig-8-like isoform X1 [Aphis craccivora]
MTLDSAMITLNKKSYNVSYKLFMLQVSWIRHRDIHILTVGAYTYTSDQRFQAIHHRSHSDQWTLHIKWAQKRDAGIYECQVSTQPVRSIFVTLNVVDDKPPPSESDDSLLDMMIRDGDFTKGFYINVFACGLMLTNVC